MNNDLIINTEVANIYKENSFTSQLISQALIWEHIIVLDKKKSWYKIKQNDGYVGWINKFYTTSADVYEKYILNDNTKWNIINKRIVKITDNINNFSKYISIGSIVPIISKNKFFSIIIMPDETKYKINNDFILSYNCKIDLKEMILLSDCLLGAPYLWGGKTGFGFDCSGLIQTLFKFTKYKLPRDSCDQIKMNNLEQIKDNYMIGDLVFFMELNIISHVGVFINNKEYLHCSGYVKFNSVISKDDNFDNNLYNKIFGIYRFTN